MLSAPYTLYAILYAQHTRLFAACTGGKFLGFPKWYRGLCRGGDIRLNNINDIWQIVANIVSILLQLAGILAVVFIIIGGIKFITSQGNPEQVQNAKSTIATAIGGLILAILAVTIVNFIAGRI